MWYNAYIKHQDTGMAKTAKDILYDIATQKFKDDMVVAAIRYDIIQECIKTERRKSITMSWVVWLIFMFITAGLGALVLLKSDIIEHAGIMYGVLGIITIIISLWAIATTYNACKEHDIDMANLNKAYRERVHEIMRDHAKEFLAIIGTYSETECKRQRERFDLEVE